MQLSSSNHLLCIANSQQMFNKDLKEKTPYMSNRIFKKTMHLKKKGQFSPKNNKFQQFLYFQRSRFPIVGLYRGFRQVKLGCLKSVYRCCKIFINVNQSLNDVALCMYTYSISAACVHKLTFLLQLINCAYIGQLKIKQL